MLNWVPGIPRLRPMVTDNPLSADPTPSPDGEPIPLTRVNLLRPPAVKALGQLAALGLFEHGYCCFWMNPESQVELVPIQELQVDLLPEDQAIQYLIQASYDDDKLKSYLKGRDARRSGL